MSTINRSSGVTADSDVHAYHSYEDVIIVHVNYINKLAKWRNHLTNCDTSAYQYCIHEQSTAAP